MIIFAAVVFSKVTSIYECFMYIHVYFILLKLFTVRSLTGGFVCCWDLPFILCGNCWFQKRDNNPQKKLEDIVLKFLKNFLPFWIEIQLRLELVIYGTVTSLNPYYTINWLLNWSECQLVCTVISCNFHQSSCFYVRTDAYCSTKKLGYFECIDEKRNTYHK